METLDKTITLNHFNGLLDIAQGEKDEPRWKNKKVSWHDFLIRISQTTYTRETVSEYFSSTKKRQTKLKDVGGFILGYAVNGGRKKSDILHRSALSFDLDFASKDFWENFTLDFAPYASALYSTHSHTPEKPKLRLIMPLDREVQSEEFEAISRKVAEQIGLDMFDKTCFRPTQLMFWPSTPKDGEFIFEYLDGAPLSADEILNSYNDWRDVREWPRHDAELDLDNINRRKAKQEDPLTKTSIVGEFCRAYTIREAIDEYLQDEYESCDMDDRYTYKKGSTAGGLVIYDDKFAFSHHNTDPASGELCNAFDLVRLHLFGYLDAECKPNTPISKRPSFKEMRSKALDDQKVRLQRGIESFQDFEDPDEETEAIDLDWIKQLDPDPTKKGYLSTIKNITTILRNDPELKGKFALNKFEQREVITGDLPWRKYDSKNPYLTDRDDANLRFRLEDIYKISGRLNTFDAMQIIMEENSFHPVKDYLFPLSWDGKQRLETLLIDYLGAEDTPYTRAVTRKSFIAGVARIFNPGCKFDYVLVIIGKQGTGKSTLIKKLGQSWYSDSFSGFQGKEAYEQIQSVWILEMAELAGLNKAEMDQIKHYISKQEDRFRVAYGKRTENFPRQCIFIGTTNSSDFLKDPTGNRRFWPVQTGLRAPAKDLFNGLTQELINQLWAEAVYLYNDGEDLFLDHELEQEAFAQQTVHRIRDDRFGGIEKFLNTKLPEDWNSTPLQARRNYLHDEAQIVEVGTLRRNRTCIAEIWCEHFLKPQSEMTSQNTKDLHSIMRTMPGWEESKGGPKLFKIYGNQRCYQRIDTGDEGLNDEKGDEILMETDLFINPKKASNGTPF